MLTITTDRTVTVPDWNPLEGDTIDLVVWRVIADAAARCYVTDQWLSSPGDVHAAVVPHPDGEQALVFGRGVWEPEETTLDADGTVASFTFAPCADNPPFLVPLWNLDDTDDEPSCSHATESFTGPDREDAAAFVAWLNARGIPATVGE